MCAVARSSRTPNAPPPGACLCERVVLPKIGQSEREREREREKRQERENQRVTTAGTGRLYHGSHVDERHRHRYEVNPQKVPELSKTGLKFVGMDETGQRMEIVEFDTATHPFYVAAQVCSWPLSCAREYFLSCWCVMLVCVMLVCVLVPHHANAIGAWVDACSHECH